MADWTKSDLPDLAGKVFIVTGANSGIGYETALALAEKGASVVMACRSLERGQRAADSIRQAAPSASTDVMQLNLASLDSVQSFARSLKEKYDRLDGLINNGGTVGSEQKKTADGYEYQFGANHLGHFALTGLLLDVLLKTPSSRVVTVSSRMHASAEIAWDDLMSEQTYDRWKAYTQSKLANILFAFELSRRLQASGASTMSVAAHPGLANTGWADNNLSGFMKLLGKVMSAFTYQPAEMAALPLLYAAVDADVQPGGYYGPENDTKGYPEAVEAGATAHDEANAARLWELSEELTGVQYEALAQD